jgi:hypothetical protein
MYSTLYSKPVVLSEKTIDNISALILPPYETDLGGVKIVNGKYIYSFNRNAPWNKVGTSEEISEKLFNQMLSTFRFIK